MNFILLNIIRLYWRLIPASKRRNCIFRKSCSNHVFDQTNTHGFKTGVKALIFRIKNCHPEFDIFTNHENGKKQMILKTGEIIDENQISERLK
jgi:putative component of membrane protein insertase Oxa1/YidC/SpoIIIJ protein YidD